MPQEERALIDAVERRLAQKYAALPQGHVAAVVQQTYTLFDESSVRDFIPLLVERRANQELTRLTARRAAVAKRSLAAVSSDAIRHLWNSASTRRRALTKGG